MNITRRFLLAAAALAGTSAHADESVEYYLSRIAALNHAGPHLNAVIAVNPDAARAAQAARKMTGPLAGKPILIKDNIETIEPLATTAGSLALASNVTGRDAPLVARLRAAGVVILGKSNLSEWANIRSSAASSGWSAVGGQTRNPNATDPHALRIVIGQRRRRCGRPCLGGDRHRNRWIDHLPFVDERRRRVQTDGRPGQPHACRADQP